MFQPFGNHFLFEDDFYLVLRQIPPVHFLQPDFIADERVFVQYAVITGNDNYALEKLHELGGRVITALAGCTQIQLEISNEHRGYFPNGNIRKVIFALYELRKMAACNLVFAVGRYRLGYSHKLFHVLVVLLEQGKDGFVVLAVSQELVFHFFGGNVIITPLHFVVDGVQRCTYVVKQGVYLSGIPAFRFSGYHIPVFRLDALLCTELAQLSVNGDTCHNHNLTVFLLRTFL